MSRRKRPNVLLPEDAIPITMSEGNYRRATHIEEDVDIDGISADASRWERYLRRAGAVVAPGLFVVLLLASFAFVLLRAHVDAQPAGPAQDIARALLEHVRLPSGHYVAHCRSAHGGCEARMRRTAELFVRSGFDHRIDPWLLAAIALRESGEAGLMQLHPRSRAGREAAERCAASPRACPAIQVDAAARLLRASIDRCGSEALALGAYNTGRCEENAYARAVLARRDRMRGAS